MSGRSPPTPPGLCAGGGKKGPFLAIFWTPRILLWAAVRTPRSPPWGAPQGAVGRVPIKPMTAQGGQVGRQEAVVSGLALGDCRKDPPRGGACPVVEPGHSKRFELGPTGGGLARELPVPGLRTRDP